MPNQFKYTVVEENGFPRYWYIDVRQVGVRFAFEFSESKIDIKIDKFIAELESIRKSLKRRLRKKKLRESDREI